ncbi:MAG TPA: hypothetical protein VGN12_01255 [Pirellulales bacterium]|jgi:hypothetical protein
MSLKRHTLSQQASPTDIRFQQVLDDLAMVARDPAALPAYASIFAGTAQITDTAQLPSSTTLGPGAVGAQMLTPQLQRTVFGNWTLDPINSPEKLEVIRCACQWIVYGPEFASRSGGNLLASPLQAPGPGRHFGVLDRLTKLPSGWLQVGRSREIPRKASYKARSNGTCVWVMPEGVQGLADFSLIVQDIARIDINSPTLYCLAPKASDLTFPTMGMATPNCIVPCVKTNYIVAEVSIGPCGNLVPDFQYLRYRVENVGSDANLRSQINAAASGLH